MHRQLPRIQGYPTIQVDGKNLGDYVDFKTTNLHRLGREWLVFVPRIETFATICHGQLVADCHYEMSLDWRIKDNIMQVVSKFNFISRIPRFKPTIRAALEFRQGELE